MKPPPDPPMVAAAKRRQNRSGYTNPLDYVDGVALGKHLSNPGPWPKNPTSGNTGPPIQIPNTRRKRR